MLGIEKGGIVTLLPGLGALDEWMRLGCRGKRCVRSIMTGKIWHWVEKRRVTGTTEVGREAGRLVSQEGFERE